MHQLRAVLQRGKRGERVLAKRGLVGGAARLSARRELGGEQRAIEQWQPVAVRVEQMIV